MNGTDDKPLPPHEEFTVRTDDYLHEDLRHLLRTVRPKWDEEKIQFKRTPRSLSHGVMNTMVICFVSSPSDDGVMCRVYGGQLITLVKHKTEVEHIRFLESHCDFVPHVIKTFTNGFCYDYIVGEPLSNITVRLDSVWRRIAAQMAKMHTIPLPKDLQNKSPFIEFFFQVIAAYPEKMTDPALDERFQREFPRKEVILKEQEELQKEIAELQLPDGFIHGDIRPENMVWNPETDEVIFVDFECCGMFASTMDIAYHFFKYVGNKKIDFSELPTDDFQKEWLRVYLEEFFHCTGKNRDDVTDRDLERLFVQVKKTYLLLLLGNVLLGPMMKEMNLFQDMPFDIFQFSTESYQEYERVKHKIMALKMPD